MVPDSQSTYLAPTFGMDNQNVPHIRLLNSTIYGEARVFLARHKLESTRTQSLSHLFQPHSMTPQPSSCIYPISNLWPSSQSPPIPFVLRWHTYHDCASAHHPLGHSPKTRQRSHATNITRSAITRGQGARHENRNDVPAPISTRRANIAHRFPCIL